MATAREKYEAARRNQANMLAVENALKRESFSVLGLAAGLTNQQDVGGYLRRVVPGLIDRYGKVNATAALNYYDEQRRVFLETRAAGRDSSSENRRRAASRFASARLRGEIYVATIPEFNALEKAEPIIGFGVQTFNKSGYDSMQEGVTNALTRAVASYNRDTLLYNSAIDSAVVKVQRVAEPNACGFCRTMAFESFRVRTKAGVRTADYAIKFHDNCRCSIETLYEGDEPIRPEYYDQFEREYEQASSDRAPGQTVIERMNQIARS